MSKTTTSFNVLFLWDFGANTGYGMVSKNLIYQFKKAFGDTMRATIIAINYFGEDYQDGNIKVFSAKKSTPPDYKDDFGRYFLLKQIKENDFDLIFVLIDPGVICPVIKSINELRRKKKEANRPSFKTMLYFPVDSPVFAEAIPDIELFDCLVTYNEYGRNQIQNLKPFLKGRIRAIPHGIDKRFFPISKDEIADFRKTYFGDLADKFIIINVNRNQPRKDIGCTIFAFQEYKKTNKDAVLYLHMNPEDPMGGHLRTIFWQTEFKEGRDFMFPPKAVQNADTSLETLNKIYNAADVYLTTTRGEGWGLSVTEAMATRLPVICPLHTSLIEITNNGERAYLLKDFYPVVSESDCIIRDQCDYLETAEMLDLVNYNIRNNTDEHRKKLAAAYEYSQTLSWNDIGKKWVKLIKEII